MAGVGPNLSTTTLSAAFAALHADTLVITRRVPNGTGPNRTFIEETIYAGPGDIQESTGNVSYNPSGAIEQHDGIAIIDQSSGPLPSVQVDDIVQANGNSAQTYTVAAVSLFSIIPSHIELSLKRGPLTWRGKT